MRRIIKSTAIPPSLKGLTPPESTTEINPALYKAPDVKRQLLADHHSKCAYCECRLNGDYGHIEHFRPKAGYTIPPSNKLITPGYYWLAYDWHNLLLSCSTCNTTYKQNHFALEDESQRDILNKDIAGEVSLLINPSTEDPNLYLEFHQHIVAPRLTHGKENAKGKYTIQLLQLNNRADLVRYRREIWDKFIRWKKVKTVATELINSKKDTERGNLLLTMANKELSFMISEEAEYSSMFL